MRSETSGCKVLVCLLQESAVKFPGICWSIRASNLAVQTLLGSPRISRQTISDLAEPVTGQAGCRLTAGAAQASGRTYRLFLDGHTLSDSPSLETIQPNPCKCA